MIIRTYSLSHCLEDNYVEFKYTNWKDEEHTYLVDPESVEYGPYGTHGHTGSVGEKNWVLHGRCVARDGQPRRNTPRRTFLLENIEEVERDAKE